MTFSSIKSSDNPQTSLQLAPLSTEEKAHLNAEEMTYLLKWVDQTFKSSICNLCPVSCDHL